MKNLILLAALIIVATALGCCLVSPKLVPPAAGLVGAWKGESTFLDRDLAAEYGAFPVAVEIAADGSATGSIGSARLAEALVREREGEFVVEGRLDGDVFPTGSLPAQGKSLFVMILGAPVDAHASGNLHLKSNGVFDFTLRVCGLELAKR